MKKFRIVFEGERERKRFGADYGIHSYYKNMVTWWNSFLDSRSDWETDGRTNKYKAMSLFAESMLYLQDMIIQTEEAHRAEVEALKKELSKWTENRGRKPLLTESDRAEIKKLRADGYGCRRLAKRYGVSERTIRRVTGT